MKRMIQIIVLLIVVGGCTPQYTVNELQATAEIQGCWPYNELQPIHMTATATKTPEPSTTPTVPPEGLQTEIPATVWPECTPLPSTPTKTMTPIPQPTRRPPETPAAPIMQSGMNTQELGDSAGVADSLSGAFNEHGDFIGAWIAWGFDSNEYHADVLYRIFVRGEWKSTRTINPEPVRKAFGGVAVAISLQTVWIAWGDAEQRIWISTSDTWGEDWTTTPTPYYGAVQDMRVEADAMHLLWRTSANTLAYGEYSSQGAWEDEQHFVGTEGKLAIYESDRYIAIANAGRNVQLWQAARGSDWMVTELPTNQYMEEEHRQSIDLIVTNRGSQRLIGVIWGQYALPGIFAAYSLDNGSTWSPEEVVAMKDIPRLENGELAEEGYRAGYKPTLIYNPHTDALGAIWHQVDVEHGWKIVFSFRPLTDGETWNATTINDEDHAIPLSTYGWTGRVVQGSPVRQPAILMIETRNLQFRVVLQPFNPASLIEKSTS